jgi:hypothetical protein
MNEGAVVLISFRYRIFNVADSKRTAGRAPDTRPGGAADCSCQTRPQELWIHIQRFLITVAAVTRFDLDLNRPNGHHSGHLQHCQL